LQRQRQPFRGFGLGGAEYTERRYEYDTTGAVNKIKYLEGALKREEHTVELDKRGYIKTEGYYENYGEAKQVGKTYTYDAIGRVTKMVTDTTADEATTTKTTTYAYDKVGNRTSMNEGTNTHTYTYDEFHRLTVDKKDGVTDATYTYDARGNQKQEVAKKDRNGTLENQTTTYTYDLASRLVGTSAKFASESDPHMVTQDVYNGDGVRIRHSEAKTPQDVAYTKFVYVGDALLFTTDANNNKAERRPEARGKAVCVAGRGRFTVPPTGDKSMNDKPDIKTSPSSGIKGRPGWLDMPRPKLVLYILLALMLAFSAAMLILENAQRAGEESALKELAPTDSAPLKKYQELHAQNADMVGWIKIDGTVIDYPVMHTPQDGEFYLSHGFDKEDSKSGVPFIDKRCKVAPFGTNTIIYGHHMKNGTMFAGLERYADQEYYKAHPAVRFDTLYEEQEYRIIAAFRSQIYRQKDTVFKHYNFLNAQNKADFDEYIANIKALALYDTGVTAQYGDQLLTLVTCAYHTENGQFVVVAKKI